jgi:site-specific recombinase XerD
MKFTEVINRYVEHLTIGGYSKATIKNYRGTIDHFLDYYKSSHSGIKLTDEVARAYLLSRINEGKSWPTVNCDYSAILTLYTKVLDVPWSIKKIPRPRMPKQQPNILTQELVQKIINNTSEYSHQIIFTFLYGTGMRISEALNLRMEDIDGKRLQIKVKCGKGKKDRVITVPLSLIETLRTYYKIVMPKDYLFNCKRRGHPMSARTVQNAFQQAKRRCKILQKVSVHTLRHCYATHHLENGTDLVTVQDQLGHNNIKTTVNYIHLCVDPSKIKHPVHELKVRYRHY